MTVKTFKAWYLVHKWTSLICTVFLLMLCITGLPLIFHHELDHILSGQKEPADAPMASLDRVLQKTLEARPDEKVLFMSWDADEPELVFTTTAKTMTETENFGFIIFDARTTDILRQASTWDLDFMQIVFKLHVDMFAGLPGKLFSGFMGLLFVVAIVTGIAVPDAARPW